MPGKPHDSILQMMDNLLKEVNLEKQAANLDLASDSKSSHPSANVDDGTRPASEGARSAENKADIAAQVPNNVEESESKNMDGGSKKPTDDMGTVSMDSDTAAAGNVETPKKDHSNSMSDSGPGDDTFSGNWDKASAALLDEANGLLGEIAKIAGDEIKPEDAPAAEPAAADAPAAGEAQPASDPSEGAGETPAADAGAGDDKSASDVVGMYKAASAKFPEDEEAGYVAASMLVDYLSGQEKQASSHAQVVADLRKEAQADAEAYHGFLQGYTDSLTKQSMPAGLEGLMGGGGGEGGPPMPEGEMPPEGGGGDEEAAMAALAGAGGPGGEGGEEGGGELDDEAVIEALAEALDEAGVTPEELAEAVAEAQGGGGEAPMGGEGAEGALAGLGGGAPMGGPEGGPPMEVAAAATRARTKSAAASKKGALKAAVQQLVRGQ